MPSISSMAWKPEPIVPRKFPYDQNELYSWLLPQGALGTSLGAHLDERHEMWNWLMKFPEYGPYWKEVAADQWFESPPRLVPALHVHGFWDQEDIYGSPAAYAALERLDTNNDLNFFAAGPWYHGQHFEDGSSLGELEFGENTSERFREEVLAPFLRHFLHEGETELPAPVTVFETGTNRWLTLRAGPLPAEEMHFYLQPGGKLSFHSSGRGGCLHRVPLRSRPPGPLQTQTHLELRLQQSSRHHRPGSTGWWRTSASWTDGPMCSPG